LRVGSSRDTGRIPISRRGLFNGARIGFDGGSV